MINIVQADGAAERAVLEAMRARAAIRAATHSFWTDFVED